MDRILKLRPTPKQLEVYDALEVKDEVFFGGGAGGGKSWLVCESRLANAYIYPGYRSFIGRDELKRLMQSTYITWAKVCKHYDIPTQDWHFNGQYNYIEFFNKSRVDFLDLKYLPSDPLYERFGSLEYSDGAIEEAGEVDAMAKDALKSRIGRTLVVNRNGVPVRPTMLITGNPKKNWTYRDYYKPWKEGKLADNKAFIQALYKDNPYTSEAYGHTLSQIQDKITRERLMLGNWEYESDPDTMIKFEAIQDLFTNTITESKEKYLVVDAARYGRDFIVYSLWRGLDWYEVFYRTKQGIDETIQDIKNLAQKAQIPYSHILVDEDGVGGGIVDHLQGIKGFVANRIPFQSQVTGAHENYKNLKAQCAYVMADKVNNHLAKVSFKDEKAKEFLTADLEQFRVKNADADRKKQVVGKDEMKEHLGRSPDFGDCFIAGTQISTPFGYRSIENIKVGEFVLTPFGISKVGRLIHKQVTDLYELNGELIGTGNHRLLTGDGLKRLDLHSHKDYNYRYKLINLYLWKLLKRLHFKGSNIGLKEIMQEGTTITLPNIKHCTGIFGNFITKGKYLVDILSITLTVIGIIILQRICNLFQLRNTQKFIRKQYQLRQSFVSSVDCLLNQSEGVNQSSAQTVVAKNTIIERNSITKKENASIVGNPFLLKKAKGQKPVHTLVRHISDGLIDVYTLTLEKDNAYFANDYLVENCFLMRMYFEVRKDSETVPEYKQPPYEPISQYEGGQISDKKQDSMDIMFQ